MKDQKFAKLLALVSAYCGLGVAAFLMMSVVATTGVRVGSVFAQTEPTEAVAALTFAQTQAILGLLQSFGADNSVVQRVENALSGDGEQPGTSASSFGSSGSYLNSSTTPPSAANIHSRVCPQIIRTLGQGANGSDVGDLQDYLGVEKTGYFGPLTAQAVGAFQANEGLEQVGTVGPLTRAAFAKRCGWVENNQNFSATPARGPAPLTVSFRANILSWLDVYSIDFGDGTTGALQNNCQLGLGACGLPTATHTYATDGTYTAKLLKSASTTDANPPPPQVVGTATIKVGTNACPGAGCPDIPPANFSASPISGATPLAVTFTSLKLSAGSGPYEVSFGDYTSDYMSKYACYNSTVANTAGSCDMSVTHTYTSVGIYTANLWSGTNQKTPIGTVTIKVGTNACSGAGCPDVPITNSTCEHSAPPAGCSWKAGATCAQDQLACSNTGNGSTFSCPVYQTIACPAGSHRVDGAPTYDANRCEVSHWSCIPNTTSSTGTSTTSICPVYQTTACPAGQHRVDGASIYDANNCAVPNWSCVSDNGTSTTGTQVNFLNQSFDAAGLMAAVVAAPFDLAIDSLSNLFVMFGVGQ